MTIEYYSNKNLKKLAKAKKKIEKYQKKLQILEKYSSGDEGLSTLAIVGISVGCVVFVVALLIWYNTGKQGGESDEAAARRVVISEQRIREAREAEQERWRSASEARGGGDISKFD